MDANTNDPAMHLGPGSRGPWLRKYALVTALALAVVGTAGGLLWNSADAQPRYVTEPVQRGDLQVMVNATGTLQPINQVQVGIEISGTIRTVDVTFNDRVKAGQTLAKIDTSKLEAQMQQTESALTAARGRVLQAEATIRETKARLARLRKVHELSGGKVPSQEELDIADANAARALADAASARAAVAQSEATLGANRTDLAKATVRSPIDGVILSRTVEPGQTLAASFQTPVLFTIAEDLARMELQVDVDEADVGQVRVGQRATFSVAAYPDRAFLAAVTQVRYGAQPLAGVVTYKTVLEVDNAELVLLPGMTATATIAVQELKDVLLVPNAALRFVPPPVNTEQQGSSSLVGRLFMGGRRGNRGGAGGRPSSPAGPRVFVVRDQQLVAVPVVVEASDGMLAAISSAPAAAGGAQQALTVDTPVVIDIASAKKT